MKRYAAHQVITSRLEKPRKLWLVALEGNNVYSLSPFIEEVPFTEWIGGWIVISSFSICDGPFPMSLEDFQQRMLSEESHWNEKGEALSNTPQYAWYITPEEVAKLQVVCPRLLPAVV